MGDLYLSGQFSTENEYKWALILHNIQLTDVDNVAFTSVQKNRFAIIILHFLLQLQQLHDDETLFFERYVNEDKVISIFEETYPDIFVDIKEHIRDKSYGTTGYLKDCLNGLKKLDLIIENPAISAIKLNTDRIYQMNARISTKVSINDDIDDLINIAYHRGSSIRPSIGTISNHDILSENN